MGTDERMFSKSADVTIWEKRRVVIPGLINAHAHLGFTLLRGLVKELPLLRWLKETHKTDSCFTEEDSKLSTELGILEMINSGITCICDFNNVSVSAPIFQDIGERGVLSTILSDSWFGKMQNAETNQGCDPTFKIEKEIEQWHKTSGNTITCMLSPHSPYACSTSLLEQVKKIGEKYRIPIHTHMAEAKEEVEWFEKKYDSSPIEFLNKIGLFENGGLLAHCVHVNEKEDIVIMKEKNLGVAHCPTSNLNLSCGISPIKKMLEANILVGLGTDGSASAPMTDILSEMKIVKQFQRIKYWGEPAIPAVDVLKMATFNSAKCLGLEKDIGSIEKGKKGDIVVLNFDRLPYMSGWDIFNQVAFSTSVHNIETVLVNGKLLKYQSSLTKSIEPLIEKASKRTAEIMKFIIKDKS